MSDALPPPPPPPPNAPPQSLPPFPGSPRPRRSRGPWIALAVVLAGGGLAVLLLILGLSAWLGDSGLGRVGGSGRRGANELVEVVLERQRTSDKIAVIPVQGIIGSGTRSGAADGLPGAIQDQLDRIARDPAIRAVILRVDSPGGEVLASDEIHNALQHFQTNRDIPVVACMGSLAASGGYYVSAPCRWIVAHPLTLTGSIGVIFHGYNYRGLMDKIGIRPDIVKSGKLKDMFSGELRPGEEQPEEKAILRELVSESFQRFKQVVREGREWAHRQNAANSDDSGRPLAENWEEFADGRILSGNQALALGLVDELGGMGTALARARSLAGIPRATVVSFQSPPRFCDLFPLPIAGASAREPVSVRLDGLPTLPPLPEGRLLYLSPLHVP
ncbi:MAG: signal peptide peptidase SppA [Verrucomicrobiae bacterium]|nr:signal peptide peptidase SppA [Verrucomicrobiae bacterium]